MDAQGVQVPRGVLVLPKLQVNSQKLGVQAIAMLKCENLPRTNSTKYETQNILVKFQQNEYTPGPLPT